MCLSYLAVPLSAEHILVAALDELQRVVEDSFRRAHLPLLQIVVTQCALLDHQASDVQALLVLQEKFLDQLERILEPILLQVYDGEIPLPVAQNSASSVDAVSKIVRLSLGRGSGGRQLLQQLLCIADGQLAVRFGLSSMP